MTCTATWTRQWGSSGVLHCEVNVKFLSTIAGNGAASSIKYRGNDLALVVLELARTERHFGEEFRPRQRPTWVMKSGIQV